MHQTLLTQPSSPSTIQPQASTQHSLVAAFHPPWIAGMSGRGMPPSFSVLTGFSSAHAGTGRTGFMPVPPNNYPFYSQDEIYTPVVQADGGQLSGLYRVIVPCLHFPDTRASGQVCNKNSNMEKQRMQVLLSWASDHNQQLRVNWAKPSTLAPCCCIVFAATPNIHVVLAIVEMDQALQH